MIIKIIKIIINRLTLKITCGISLSLSLSLSLPLSLTKLTNCLPDVMSADGTIDVAFVNITVYTEYYIDA
jgi:hypothetical protein